MGLALDVVALLIAHHPTRPLYDIPHQVAGHDAPLGAVFQHVVDPEVAHGMHIADGHEALAGDDAMCLGERGCQVIDIPQHHWEQHDVEVAVGVFGKTLHATVTKLELDPCFRGPFAGGFQQIRRGVEAMGFGSLLR